jgi:nucleotide-binding universal stress UspA family protein
MFKSGAVLVPLDGSDLSERALPYAAACAKAFGSRLVLVTAVYIADIPGHDTWSEEELMRPRDVIAEYLTGVRDRLGAPKTETLVKVGYPHESLLEAADETKASLIVVSSHGRSGLNRWAYGSTAGHLLHASHVPLLVIGKDALEIAPAGFSPKHVLIPLDGSKLAEAALPAGIEAAQAFGAKVSIVRVAPLSTVIFPYSVAGAMQWPDLDQELEASARAYLDRIKPKADSSSAVEVSVLRGPPADALLEFEASSAVDLVVMTTHARSGIARALLGSTADRMLRGRAPVLFIRPTDA